VVRARFGDHDHPSTLLGVTVLGYENQLVEGGRHRRRPVNLRRDDREDLVAVLGELVLADAADAAQGGQRGRRVGGDLAQRRVVEDDVGRHALLLGGGRPPRPQPLEQRSRLGRKLHSGALVPASAGARWRLKGHGAA
jgi:hypothetical protein